MQWHLNTILLLLLLGYHLVVWLLVENEPFTLQLANAATRRYREMNDTVMKEVIYSKKAFYCLIAYLTVIM